MIKEQESGEKTRYRQQDTVLVSWQTWLYSA